MIVSRQLVESIARRRFGHRWKQVVERMTAGCAEWPLMENIN
jgi:hypothetical protein